MISGIGSPLPSGLKAQKLLIRYTITPVKEPNTQEVIGALVSGDIVNGKISIVNQTNLIYSGGYSAVYLLPEKGDFQLATASLGIDKNNIYPITKSDEDEHSLYIPLPNNSLLKAAATMSGKPVA